MKRKVVKILSILLSLIIFLSISILIFEVTISSKYSKIVKSECQKYNLDYIMVLSLIKTESNFNKNAKSNKNAIGLMQIKDETAIYVSKLYDIKYDDLYNVNSNVQLGVAYLDYLTKKFKYEDLVLCSYNAGEGAVSKWIEKGYIVDGKIKYVPYSETKNYLLKIKKLKNFYTIFYKTP
ncbi:MAG: lytic transglycosylase domain-containing protein [Clostridia bacterium]|nr:lytic transglycosylase domain-containing protein [Clostridia bacterium]